MKTPASRRLPPPATLSLCCAALLVACSAGGTETAERSRAPAPAPKVSARATAPPDDPRKGYADAVAAVLPSVVQITAGDSLGSGVVYDARGHIVTNAHVVGDAEDFEVTLATGKNPHKASLVSSYPAQDLAVIKLDEVPGGLKPAVFGDSSKIEVGHIVLAMGSPLGLSSSVTQGIVSAVGRTVSEPREGGGTGATISNLIQTSAPINPGNSGGALVSLANEVVGIPTLAATDPELGDAAAGIGFAIPSATVTDIADQIIEDGEVTSSGKAALGITGRTVLGDDYRPTGVAVVSVADDGAAARAGLKSGDIVTAVGDTRITTMLSLIEALAAHRPDDRTTVTYERNGAPNTARVTLGEL
ncbi:S1C family serine protease [Streptomyces sp. SAJ15]|uniref:S1C family serine protease n=1 Tax=Streptomyces sp. SAJ15 TaxID=2011095 RepID=UPI0011859DA6|nr:trypsin-like peptidase domain-containing protein [Streptomyces sp. SAJ15]TVL90957.1 signal protein PDZ [Streptomyces sp. SAJ15]